MLADLSLGQIYALNFVDVDGNTLSASDGHVSVVVLTTTSDWAKARTVGDRVPDYCLGDPDYRMITVLHFRKSHSALVRAGITAVIRRRIDAEAKRLQVRYAEKQIQRDARWDIFVIVDFDGTATSRLGAEPASSVFLVLVFGRNGELLRRWNDVPTAEQLAAVVK